MARDRSEDAVSWNVFRYLENSGRLVGWLNSATAGNASDARVHYWSFDSRVNSTWEPLAKARVAFRELEGRGSEPDIVIETEDAYVWIEAKFGSTNKTTPSDADGAQQRYTSGGGRWYAHSMRSPFAAVAIEHRRYELLRLWLLGSWVAAQHGKQFNLVNLVRQGKEEDAPSFAAAHFRLAPSRRVHRVTWESVHDFVSAAVDHTDSDVVLLNYMKNKSLGYNSAGELIRAFALA